MLKVVNIMRLYLRDLQSRSFVFVFLFFLLCALSVKNERQQRPLGFAASLVEELGQH